MSVSAGSCVIAFVFGELNVATTISDSVDGTTGWVQVGSNQFITTTYGTYASIFKKEGITSGSRTFTSTRTAGYTSLFVVEIAGNSPMVSGYNTAVSDDTSNPRTSNTYDNTATTEMLLCFCGDNVSAVHTFSWQSSFSEVTSLGDNTNWTGSVGSRLVTSLGSYSGSVNTSQDGEEAGLVIVGVKETSGVQRVGTAVTIDVSGNSSQSITIPSDAEIVLAYGAGYWTNPSGLPNPAFTLSGTAMTRIVAVAADVPDNDETWVEYRVNPATGSQTLAWDFTNANAYGAIVVVFYKGINTSSPIRSSQGQNSAGTGSGETISITGLTYQSGDMIVGGATSDAVAATMTSNGQTAIASAGQTVYVAVGEKANTGDFTATSAIYGSLVAVVLAKADTGGGIISAWLRA
jgi:hypothetical protein